MKTEGFQTFLQGPAAETAGNRVQGPAAETAGNRVKKNYSGQKLFFVLDKDLDDSSKFEALIHSDGDIVQFLMYNSEHLLLKLSGKNPKEPSDFNNLKDFRDYSEVEFLKQFKKVAPEFKDPDFESVFAKLNDKEIRATFTELFATLS